VVVIVAFVLVNILGGKGSSKPALAGGTHSQPPYAVSEVEGVHVSALVDNTETASGDGVTPPKRLPPNAPRVNSDGHPEIMYIGAEYCFLCAGERWALVMALSKFGTFSNLTGTTPSASAIPSGPTFSFSGATYTSKYLSFVTDEKSFHAVKSSTGLSGSVQILTQKEHNIITAWDVAPYTTESGSLPFVYMGGKFLLTGSQYDAGAISQMKFQTAAGVMTSGKSTVSKHVEAAAGYLVGDFCALTHGQPASVCAQVPSSLIGITTSSATNQGSSAPKTVKKGTIPTSAAKAKTSTSKKAATKKASSYT
jgi:hypothetical protein